MTPGRGSPASGSQNRARLLGNVRAHEGRHPRRTCGVARASSCGLGCTRGARNEAGRAGVAHTGRITGRAVIAMEAIALK